MSNPNLNWNPGMTIESIEKDAILQALRFYRGNKTATANALGIAIRTLDNKIAQYEQDAKKEEAASEIRKQQREEFQRRSRGPAQVSQVTVQTATGVRMESAPDASKEHAVPLPVGSKVQEVSPRTPAESSSAKTRR